MHDILKKDPYGDDALFGDDVFDDSDDGENSFSWDDVGKWVGKVMKTAAVAIVIAATVAEVIEMLAGEKKDQNE